MKKIFKLLFILPLLFLNGCSSNIEDNKGDGYINTLPSETKDGNIFHAFNWTYSDIKISLPTLSEAGFKSVQTSPVQQPKSGGSEWYFLYQPCSFYIAKSSPLGTKEELEDLCKEADKYNMSIIVDIVFNHMATTGEVDSNGFYVVDPEVEEYEPEIYADLDTYFHRTPYNELGSLGSITQWYDGLPDLNTSNPLIQEKCLNLLKECIDVGVDGFRFDAAKHIETPTDEEYASSFWDNTLEVAKTYYKQVNQGKELYAYGEILNDVGGSRDISSYTKYMNVTDNTYISNVSQGYSQADGSKIAKSSYQKNTDASNIVTWAESHDTFAHSSHASKTDEIKLYSLVATRKDSRSLYLSRPYETSGEIKVGVIGSYTFEDSRIAEANRFHNRFIDAEEYLHGEDALYICERYSETDEGVFILNTIQGDNEEKEISLEYISDGIYFDELTNKAYEVKNGKLNIAISTKAMVFLTKSNHTLRPSYSFSSRNTSYLDTIDVEITIENSISSSYKIDDEEEVSFTDSLTLTIGKDVDMGKTTTIIVKASNGVIETKRTIYFKKFSLIEGGFNVFNFNSSYLDEYELYLWSWDSSTSMWNKDYKYDEDNDILLVYNNNNYSSFLLALFEKGHEISNLTSWDSACLKQSEDISFSSKYYDATKF